MPVKILLAGEGGQGIQSAAKIIANAAKLSHKNVNYLPSFGVEQRGGVSLAYIQFSENKINYPRFNKANIVVCFSNRSIESVKDYLDDNSLFVFDSSVLTNKNIEKIKPIIKRYLMIPADKIAKEKYSIRVVNMILIGAITTQFKDISYTEFEKAITKEFKEKSVKNPNIEEMNLSAFKEGINLAENFNANITKISGINEIDPQRTFEKEDISWTRFPEYCKGCDLCIHVCPVKALSKSKDNNFLQTQMPIVDINKCIGCKKCMHICPDGAIQVKKK